MSGKYKLTYFDARGMAEAIRLILKAADKEFEDIRIKREEWPEMKPKTPTGVLPLLETPDGKVLTQSLAIARYLAKLYGFYGSTDCDLYMIERVVEQVRDVFMEILKLHFADESKKAELKEEFHKTKGPQLLKALVTFLSESEGGFFVGDKATLADFYFLPLIDVLKQYMSDLIAEFPKLTEHYDHVVKSIPTVEDWVKSRPQTEF